MQIGSVSSPATSIAPPQGGPRPGGPPPGAPPPGGPHGKDHDHGSRAAASSGSGGKQLNVVT